MYVKIENGVVAQYPYTLAQMLTDNPATSFPADITTELRESFGVFDVDYLGAPEFDPLTHRVEHSPLPSLVDGKWMLTNTVVEKTSEQIAVDTANKAAQVRAERNKKLTATDWTQLADSTADKAVWAEYRQALRDITAQAGFPWTIDWPVQP
jgi:endo-1,4-beta-mannosidase